MSDPYRMPVMTPEQITKAVRIIKSYGWRLFVRKVWNDEGVRMVTGFAVGFGVVLPVFIIVCFELCRFWALVFRALGMPL